MHFADLSEFLSVVYYPRSSGALRTPEPVALLHLSDSYW